MVQTTPIQNSFLHHQTVPQQRYDFIRPSFNQVRKGPAKDCVEKQDPPQELQAEPADGAKKMTMNDAHWNFATCIHNLLSILGIILYCMFGQWIIQLLRDPFQI